MVHSTFFVEVRIQGSVPTGISVISRWHPFAECGLHVKLYIRARNGPVEKSLAALPEN